MVTRYRRRSRSKRLILPIITLAFLGYFAHHAFHGDYGIAARASMVADKERLAAELVLLGQERENLEAHVKLLRPQSTDRDLADERARAAVGLVRQDELVLFFEDGTPSTSMSLVEPKAGIARLISKYQ